LEFGMTVPPLLRYGKYCGLLYSGCPGEKPCDGLDACCMKHDQCVQAKNSEFSNRFSIKTSYIMIWIRERFGWILPVSESIGSDS